MGDGVHSLYLERTFLYAAAGTWAAVNAEGTESPLLNLGATLLKISQHFRRWGAQGLCKSAETGDNIHVVRLFQVSRRRNLGVPPSARVFAARPAHEGMRCRCGFDVALCKQRGPVDGVFKSLVPGRSGDWSV